MAERMLLLDREGTVLRSPDDVYVRTWDDVELMPDAIATIVHAAARSFVPVLVTNQSCVNRGIVTQAWVDEVNAWLVAQVVAAGGPDFLTLSCPHVDADGCACRKPLPGMLLEAAARTGLSVHKAWFVGDSIVDLGAARAAGIGTFLGVGDPVGTLCSEPDVECLPAFSELRKVVDRLEDG